MDHADVVAKLDEYRDGELPPGLAGEVAGHLEGCAGCREELAARVAMARSLSGLVRTEPSEAFVRSVMERVAGEGRRVEARWLTPALATGLAVACLFVALGLAGGNADSQSAVPDLLAMGDRETVDAYRAVESAESPSADQLLGMIVEEES